MEFLPCSGNSSARGMKAFIEKMIDAADSSEERKKELVELVLCWPISTFFREKRAIPEKILFLNPKQESIRILL